METYSLSDFLARYVIVPLITGITALGWYMFKKQDKRIDDLEKRTTETEKSSIEINTSFKYIARDIKEIKELVTKLNNRH